MALLGFLSKKKTVNELDPPKPEPSQAASSSLPPANDISKEKVPEPVSPTDTLPPLVDNIPLGPADAEVPDIPPAFDTEVNKPASASIEVAPAPPTTAEDAHIDDLPEFDKMPEIHQAKKDLADIKVPEHNLPTFEEMSSDLPKMEEGITPEQKAKLEEVVSKAPTAPLKKPDSTLNSDIIKHELAQEETVAQELHEATEHKDAEKMISYDHDIKHTADVGAQKVDVPPSPVAAEPKFDKMQDEVEEELDEQVNKFSLDELNLRRDGDEDIKPLPRKVKEKVVPKNIAPQKPKVIKKDINIQEVTPMDQKKQKDLLSKKKYYLQTKPIFIYIDKYRYVLERLHESKACLKGMESTSQGLFEINKNQEVLTQSIIETFEQIQESLIFVDHTIFKEEQ